MGELASPRRVASAAELVQDVGVSIDGFTFYKVAAEVRDDFTGPITIDEESEVSPSYALKLRNENGGIGVRLSTHLELAIGTVDVDVAIDYSLTETVEVPQHVLLEFANEVGVMALIPYVRESIANLSARVFNRAVLMPMIQRGELSFDAEGDDDSE